MKSRFSFLLKVPNSSLLHFPCHIGIIKNSFAAPPLTFMLPFTKQMISVGFPCLLLEHPVFPHFQAFFFSALPCRLSWCVPLSPAASSMIFLCCLQVFFLSFAFFIHRCFPEFDFCPIIFGDALEQDMQTEPRPPTRQVVLDPQSAGGTPQSIQDRVALARESPLSSTVIMRCDRSSSGHEYQ